LRLRQSMSDLWWTQWDRLCPSSTVFSCQCHSSVAHYSHILRLGDRQWGLWRLSSTETLSSSIRIPLPLLHSGRTIFTITPWSRDFLRSQQFSACREDTEALAEPEWGHKIHQWSYLWPSDAVHNLTPCFFKPILILSSNIH
jgi:hypothetical protein